MNENETRKRNVTVKDKTNHKMEEKQGKYQADLHEGTVIC